MSTIHWKSVDPNIIGIGASLMSTNQRFNKFSKPQFGYINMCFIAFNQGWWI